MDIADIVEAAGLPRPGTRPGYVQKRETQRGCALLSAAPAGRLGPWQTGAIALVEESWRRRERTPFGDRYRERSQSYLVIEEAGRVPHRHPVPRTCDSVREALAWCLRVNVERLAQVQRCQGDVYVLRAPGLRGDALPPRHDIVAGERGAPAWVPTVEANGTLGAPRLGPGADRLVHPQHAPIAAPEAGEVVRVCRRASECRHATGGSRD